MSKELTTSGRPVAVPQLGPEARLALDVALGVAGVTVGAAVVAVRTVHRVTAPLTRLLWHPPLVPTRFHPATVVADLARTGGADREELRRRAEVLLDAWVPALVAMIVERIDITQLVEDNVDLDQIVSTVDLDAAVARVDLDAAVARVDLDAPCRVDLDAVVAPWTSTGWSRSSTSTRWWHGSTSRPSSTGSTWTRWRPSSTWMRWWRGPTSTPSSTGSTWTRWRPGWTWMPWWRGRLRCRHRPDRPGRGGGQARRGCVVARADFDAVIDRIDLDAVAAKLDVDAVVARADLDAVIERIDIVGIIGEVLDVIDLPAIIRDSSGSMASETVRGVRMTGINADDALSRVVDRALFRRRHHNASDAPQ